MRNRHFCLAPYRTVRGLAIVVLLTSAVFAQQPPAQGTPAGVPAKRSVAEAPPALEKLLESKVKAEWEAIKARDAQAFGKLLTDDFIAVESDGDGARRRYKVVAELASSAVRDYHLQLFKAFSLAPGVVFVKYENTMEFSPKAAVRYKRLWISEIWLQRAGDWRMWRYQETSVK